MKIKGSDSCIVRRIGIVLLSVVLCTCAFGETPNEKVYDLSRRFGDLRNMMETLGAAEDIILSDADSAELRRLREAVGNVPKNISQQYKFLLANEEAFKKLYHRAGVAMAKWASKNGAKLDGSPYAIFVPMPRPTEEIEKASIEFMLKACQKMKDAGGHVIVITRAYGGREDDTRDFGKGLRDVFADHIKSGVVILTDRFICSHTTPWGFFFKGEELISSANLAEFNLLPEAAFAYFDKDAARRAREAERQIAAESRDPQKLQILLLLKENEAASQFALDLADNDFKEEPEGLNALAQIILNIEGVERPLVELALKIATRADKLSKHSDAHILDTIALAHFQMGDMASAAAMEKRAIEMAENDEDAATFRKNLQKYAQAGAGDAKPEAVAAVRKETSTKERDKAIQQRFNDFPLIEYKANKDGAPLFQMVTMNKPPVVIEGNPYGGFRFKVSRKGEGLKKIKQHFAWAFIPSPNVNSWYILPKEGTMNGFIDFHTAPGDELPGLANLAAKKFVVQNLEGEKLVEDEEYLIWVRFDDTNPAKFWFVFQFVEPKENEKTPELLGRFLNSTVAP